MAKLPAIPYVLWREGHPRFTPSPELRALGYKGESLKHASGRWMTRGEATDWATARLAEIDSRRTAIREAAEAAAKKRKHVFVPPITEAKAAPMLSIYTVARLADDWLASPVFPQPVARSLPKPEKGDGKKSYRTMVDYRQKMRALEAHDHELFHSAVDALSQPILVGLHEDMWAKRGLHTANAVMRVLSAAISWGIRRGKVRLASNPASRMKNPQTKPRVRFSTREEIEALVAAADAIGRPEMGDMVILGVWTGQRQGDRIAMEHRGSPVKGRRVFRQSKTGAIVLIPESPELIARLASSRSRRIAAGIIDRHVVMDERTWRPWLADHYRHIWAEVRTAAVDGVIDEAATKRRADAALAAGVLPANEPIWLVPPTPTLAGFRDQDLRDTAVTWMGLAGLTIPEICSITGHSLETATSILKHYLALHPQMAASGMAKLIAWFEHDTRDEEMWR